MLKSSHLNPLFYTGIHVDFALICTTYVEIAAEYVQPFVAAVFPDASGLFQQGNAPCHTGKFVQEWCEEHDKEFKVLA